MEKSKTIRLAMIAAMLTVWCLFSCHSLSRPDAVRLNVAAGGENGVISIRQEHPRLLVTPERLAGVAASSFAPRIRELADYMLVQPVSTRVMEGSDMLSVSRQVLDRCSVLGLAHLLWGGPYAARVRDELAAVEAFSDWNPAHFLDTAEMAAAVAIGLDWCWDALSEADREQAAAAIERNAFVPSLGDAQQWWRYGDNNWNQVCHGSLVMAALAVAPAYSEMAGTILAQARWGIVSGLRAYAPEGIYPEGVAYWEYGTTFSVLMADALAGAAGEDWEVAAAPGFLASARFAQECTAPSGIPFCYADAWHYPLLLAPAVWMYARAGDGAGAAWARGHQLLTAGWMRYLPFAALWSIDGTGPGTPMPTAWCGHGQIEVASLRSAWDSSALWIGFKAGSLQVSHGHMDAGSFEMEAGGVRWFSDLGAEPEVYARSDTWSTEQDSRRWIYLRTNNTGHNLVIIGGRPQRVAGTNPIRLSGRSAIADLSASYADCADSARRGVALIGDSAMLIQDEFTGLASEPVLWQAFTEAQVQCSGSDATLTRDGIALHVRVLEPADAVFAVRTAAPPTSVEEQNAEFRRIVLELPAAAGDRRIRVLFSLSEIAAPPIRPLSAW